MDQVHRSRLPQPRRLPQSYLLSLRRSRSLPTGNLEEPFFLRTTLMRTMLIGAVMLLACLSGAARADEASAVKAVEKLGGKVTRAENLPGKPVIAVNLAGAQVTDAVLKELKDLKQLTTLNLNATPVTGAGLKELK